MSIVFLGLGSNLGDRELNIQNALFFLKQHVSCLRVSKIYETSPFGLLDQPCFLNVVCTGQTNLSPQKLIEVILAGEETLGRVRTVRWGPRLIDIDILLYDDLVIDEPGITIPHPGIPERAFVLVPLAELASDFVHPVSKKTVQQCLALVPHVTEHIWPFTSGKP